VLTLRVRPSQDEAHSARMEMQLRHQLTLNPGRGREMLKAGPGLCMGMAIFGCLHLASSFLARMANH